MHVSHCHNQADGMASLNLPKLASDHLKEPSTCNSILENISLNPSVADKRAMLTPLLRFYFALF